MDSGYQYSMAGLVDPVPFNFVDLPCLKRRAVSALGLGLDALEDEADVLRPEDQPHSIDLPLSSCNPGSRLHPDDPAYLRLFSSC